MARKGTFSFDLSKPLKKGQLLKQGAVHKAFKQREFILYPGFLVYYENESKWKLDLMKGETLGSRLGAVKLKGASVGVARNAPKGCKYGITLTAPDPTNKRQNFIMNASSKEERDKWIEEIHKAVPVSPHVKRKDIKERDSSPKQGHKPSSEASKPGDKEKENHPYPKTTTRQDTAAFAAIAIANSTDSQEEQRAVDEVITSVNSSLKGTYPAIRHDATIDQPLENGVENGDTETSIDTILGTQNDRASSSEEGSVHRPSSTPEPNLKNTELGDIHDDNTTPIVSPETDKRTELAQSESVENSKTSKGKTTVMTCVTVVCNSTETSPTSERKTKEEEEVNDSETRERSSSSTQVLVDQEGTVTFSVNLDGYETDDTLSGEESHIDLEELQTKTKEEEHQISEEGKKEEHQISEEGKKEEHQISEEGKKEEHQISEEGKKEEHQISEEGKKEEHQISEEGKKEEHQISEEGKKEEHQISEEGKEENKKSLHEITVKEDRTGNLSDGNDSPKLNPPASNTTDTNEATTPFIEKKGYLYKMGGQRKTWKLRYFVLRPGVFNYFKNSSSHKALGEVKLKNISIFFPGIGERKQSFQFTLHTESSWNRRADYVMAGQSEREMKEWITAFKMAGGRKILAMNGNGVENGH